MSKYQRGYRRMLLDMHIPDWDPAFLAKYDPAAMARLYEQAQVSSVMIYCKSHAGLCCWPSKAGKMHANLGGRDVVGEMVRELRARDIAVCAYYSIVFDNWAVETNPDWRERTMAGLDLQNVIRYGVCCQNHPDYRAYEMAQLGDLLSAYQFDALFLDMIFWPLICACDHCRERFRAEAGKEIPSVVDWTSADWCDFQAARERWASEFAAELFARARSIAPGIAVTHNLAPALANWVLAQPLSAAAHDTFVAGDLYGDRTEQLVVSRLMLHLSETRPAEFMTSTCVKLADHVRLKSLEQMRAQAMAATAMSSGFLFIDAIDPAGTVNPLLYGRVGKVYLEMRPYEQFLGGEPIEDVAVYFSSHSQMDFAENGTEVTRVGGSNRNYPHLYAVRGACRALQHAHIPFGVITRRQLAELRRFRAVVLPNVLRMDADEAAAFRDYVRAGGCLYASRYTSLVETTGIRHPDFMLADVFGASYDAEEQGAFVYLKPVDAPTAEWIAPQAFVSVPVTRELTARQLCGIPRIRAAAAEALATLTVPYGYPLRGTVADHRWASIHSSPPWQDLEVPAIVRNDFGAGRAIYSAASIESVDAAADSALFLGLVSSLLDGKFSFGADTHQALWMSAFDQPEQRRVMASFLNLQAELPAVPVPVRFSMRPPVGKKFRSLRMAPDGNALEFKRAGGGAIEAQLESVALLAMVLVEYE
jgi:hypothetical protein